MDPERCALHILHDQVVGSDIEELADVGVIQGSYGARLTLEALGKLGL